MKAVLELVLPVNAEILDDLLDLTTAEVATVAERLDTSMRNHVQKIRRERLQYLLKCLHDTQRQQAERLEHATF